MNGQHSESESQSPRARGLIADEHTAHGMARAVLRATCASWQFVAIYAAVLLIVIIVSLRTGNWFSLAAAPIVLVMIPLATLRGLTKQFRSLVPTGARLETEFRDATMVIRSPAASSEVLLSAITGLRSVGDYVVFHLAGSRAYNALPSTLFPTRRSRVSVARPTTRVRRRGTDRRHLGQQDEPSRDMAAAPCRAGVLRRDA